MVNKNTLQSLISKYYLNGSFNQVKWRIKDNTITVYAGSSGKAAKVYLKNFQFEDCELGIYDTHKLSRLLAICNGELIFQAEKTNKVFTKLNIADSNFDLSYSLADIFVIPRADYFPDIEEPEGLFELDKEAIDALIKAKTALSEQSGLLIKTATNLDGERVCEMIFGDIENFANKVTYTLNGTITDEIEFPLNSDSLKDIFSANKDADRGVLKVSAQGMIQLNFYSDEMESEYFVLRNE
tara:strand:- start:3441 stop:4160 length:720 start_codon:yes stop_codon:yes gene_type:complete